MEYKSTNNAVYSCTYHVVFCPKYRRRVLVDGVDDRFKELAPPALSEAFPGAEVVEVEVMPDHVHLMLSLPPDVPVSKAVKRIKGATSHALREEYPWLKKRIPTLWTNSYFASTTGGAPIEAVRAYIANQKRSWRESQKDKMG